MFSQISIEIHDVAYHRHTDKNDASANWEYMECVPKTLVPDEISHLDLRLHIYKTPKDKKTIEFGTFSFAHPEKPITFYKDFKFGHSTIFSILDKLKGGYFEAILYLPSEDYDWFFKLMSNGQLSKRKKPVISLSTNFSDIGETTLPLDVVQIDFNVFS